MIELSTTFSAISTSPQAKHPRTADAAVRTAKGNLRYIDRPSAAKAGDAFAAGRLLNADGSPVKTRLQGRAAMRRAIENRAKRGGRTGVRVADKLMFSLPNEFAGVPARKALRRVLRRLVGDSDAIAFGVIHTDKPDNLHCHILAVDGPESQASARARRPNAKRLRRRDALRMNEMGRPKELRRIIAEEINAVAAMYGLEGVEYESYEARGVSRTPGTHEGPQRRAREAREAQASGSRTRPPSKGRSGLQRPSAIE